MLMKLPSFLGRKLWTAAKRAEATAVSVGFFMEIAYERLCLLGLNPFALLSCGSFS